jgi:ABC-type multidrug transport system fused ATPase/permease subunit
VGSRDPLPAGIWLVRPLRRSREGLVCRPPGRGRAWASKFAIWELTKSFGRQLIWDDVTLTLPAGEVSVLLGPSGTGKSVFLKSLIGLLKPDRGSIVIRDVDIARCR